MKEEIKTSVDYLSNLCLEEAEKYNNYSHQDLVNATIIFSHFLMDTIWTTNIDLPLGKKSELAETTGKMIRELIRVSTRLDMHKLVKE